MTEITWLGHSTFVFKFPSGEILVTDPWMNGNPAHPAGYQLDRVDAIAITHGHFDHVADVIPLAEKFGCKVVGIFEVAKFFEKKGVKNTIGMNKGGSVDLGFVKLTMTHALHSGALSEGDELVYGGEAAGYVLTWPGGRRAYFAGDTAVFSDMAIIGDLYRPELAFLPIGDFYTMGPEEAAYAARLINAKRVVPMHYGTFPALAGKPADLAALVKKDGIDVWVLKTGEPVKW